MTSPKKATFKRATVHNLTVNFGGEDYSFAVRPAMIANEYLKKQNEILRLKDEIQNEVTFEKIGKAVEVIFNLVFGVYITKKLYAFYENNYAEMLLEVFPWITETIEPMLKEYREEKREKAKERYYAARKAKK